MRRTRVVFIKVIANHVTKLYRGRLPGILISGTWFRSGLGSLAGVKQWNMFTSV